VTEYVSLREAEAETGLSARSLRRRAEDGEIPGAVKTSAEWLIPREALAGIRPRYEHRPRPPAT
jgi:hypothetical protein